MKILPFLLATSLSCFAVATEPMRLTLAAPIEKWDESIPLGKGLIGSLLWGKGNELRLSLDRGDLWDLRQHPIYARPEFNYATVVARAQSGQADQLNREFARSSDFPTKLPGARLVVTLDPKFQARAFTLEGNFAAFHAAHEMLLQSWGGRVRIFPALPSAWRDMSFRDLRAEGGFVVSAEQRDGRLRRIAIRATVAQQLRLADPFSGRPYDHNLPVTRAAGEICCRLQPGQTLELTERAPARAEQIPQTLNLTA